MSGSDNENRSNKTEQSDEPSAKKIKSSPVETMFHGFAKLIPPTDPSNIRVHEKTRIGDFWANLRMCITREYPLIKKAVGHGGATVTGKFADLQAPNANEYCDDPANATPIQLVAYKIAFGSHVADKKKLEQDIQRLYSDLINSMSEASKELIQRGWGDWSTVDESCDSAKLFKRMFQTHDRPVQNVRETRAFPAVINRQQFHHALAEPLGNDQGSWRLLNLATRRTIDRSHFTVVPTTVETVHLMNSWARHGTNTVS